MQSSQRFPAAAVACAALSWVTFAQAQSAPLQAQVDALIEKVAELERKQHGADVPPSAAVPSNAVTGGATKGSFKLPGSNTSVTLGGYVKLDAIFTNPSAGVGSTADQELEAPNIPVGANAKSGERNQLKFHARQSRLFGATATPTPWGELTTYVEGDFFGTAGTETVSNSNGLRLRHAYGTLGGLLAGQTWTTFSDPATYPETLDFGGPVGVVFARQAQVRWTQAFSGGRWSLALENPETVASLPSGASFRGDDDRLPDFAANVHFDTSFGKYSIAGIARQLRVDSPSSPAVREQKLATAFGVNGVIPSFGKDDLRFSAYAGNGIGRYSIGFLSDALVDADSHLVAPTQWLAMAAYRHYWTANLRSTLALSGVGVSNPAGAASGVNKSSESAHLNVIWSPTPQSNVGLEYIFARREVQGGDSGNLNRVQASAQYFF
ncbi:MAG: DcaP family trimeric outer membrane transporter [Rudaea sp.]